MAHYLVSLHVMVRGQCRQMRFTVDAASAPLACEQAEDDALRTVDGIEDAFADRALRMRELCPAA